MFISKPNGCRSYQITLPMKGSQTSSDPNPKAEALLIEHQQKELVEKNEAIKKRSVDGWKANNRHDMMP